MANAVLYVDSAATGANNGTSWANAYTTLAAAITGSGTTGTDFCLASTHNETTASSLTYTFKGVVATPDRVFSVNKAGSTPPTRADLTPGATISCTGTSNLDVRGAMYIQGVTFNVGTGASAVGCFFANTSGDIHDIILQDCKLIQTSSGTMLTNFGNANINGCRVQLINTTIKFASANSYIRLGGGLFIWRATPNAIDNTGSLPTTLFSSDSSTRPTTVICDGVDFSALTSKTVVGSAAMTAGACVFINCKLPTGSTPIATPVKPNHAPIDLIVTDNSATDSRQSRYMYQGTLTHDTGVYNLASDGTTPISWKVVTTANANPQSPFECFEIEKWVAAGTYAASTILLTSATGSLKTDDVWAEVSYLGSSYPQSSFASTLGPGSGSSIPPQTPQGTTSGNLSTSGSWATGAQTNVYTLAIPSFTTSAAGYVRVRVKVAKPSLTVYIDPKINIA